MLLLVVVAAVAVSRNTRRWWRIRKEGSCFDLTRTRGIGSMVCTSPISWRHHDLSISNLLICLFFVLTAGRQ